MSTGRERVKRILFMDSFPRLGGAEQSLIELLTHIDRERFALSFLTSEEGELVSEVRRLGIPVHLCPMPERVAVISRTALDLVSLLRLPGPLLGYLARLERLIRSLRPHMTYSNALKDHIASALLAPMVHKPIIWHFRDLLENHTLKTFVETLALATPTHLIANSKFTAQQFPRLSRRAGRSTVVYNGMNLDEIDRKRQSPIEGTLPSTVVRDGVDLDEIDRRRKSPLTGSVPAGEGLVVGIVGAICPEKGQELLIRALPRIAEQVPVSCWIVGDEIYHTARHPKGFRSRLERIARELGVRDCVQFLGWRKDAIALINKMDILVCASDPNLSIETFGRTVAESMACEKPVVSVAWGGPLETVVDGVTGTFFHDYTPEALADAILDMVRHAQRMEGMGRAGRKRIEQLFTIGEYVRGVERTITQILGA